MIPLYMPARHKYIEDISSPTIGDAISKSKKHKKISIPVRHATKPNNLRINKSGKITRVPPMAELHYYRPKRSGGPSRNIVPILPWLPKKYTWSKGVVTDWHTKTFKELKLAAPILVSFTALMFLALSWQLPEIKNYNTGHARTVRSTNTGASNPVPAGSGSNASASVPNSVTMPSAAPASRTITQTDGASLPVNPASPVISTPPVDIEVPPVSDPSDPTPPIDVELPPVDVNGGLIDIQTPGINLGL